MQCKYTNPLNLQQFKFPRTNFKVEFEKFFPSLLSQTAYDTTSQIPLYLIIAFLFQAPRLVPELEFIRALISIGKLLGSIPTKEAKTVQLVAELNTLNLNLPARVWLPLHSTVPHHIVRIPPQYAAVLNSKDKVMFKQMFKKVKTK